MKNIKILNKYKKIIKNIKTLNKYKEIIRVKKNKEDLLFFEKYSGQLKKLKDIFKELQKLEQSDNFLKNRMTLSSESESSNFEKVYRFVNSEKIKEKYKGLYIEKDNKINNFKEKVKKIKLLIELNEKNLSEEEKQIYSDSIKQTEEEIGKLINEKKEIESAYPSIKNIFLEKELKENNDLISKLEEDLKKGKTSGQEIKRIKKEIKLLKEKKVNLEKEIQKNEIIFSKDPIISDFPEILQLLEKGKKGFEILMQRLEEKGVGDDIKNKKINIFEEQFLGIYKDILNKMNDEEKIKFKHYNLHNINGKEYLNIIYSDYYNKIGINDKILKQKQILSQIQEELNLNREKYEDLLLKNYNDNNFKKNIEEEYQKIINENQDILNKKDINETKEDYNTFKNEHPYIIFITEFIYRITSINNILVNNLTSIIDFFKSYLINFDKHLSIIFFGIIGLLSIGLIITGLNSYETLLSLGNQLYINDSFFLTIKNFTNTLYYESSITGQIIISFLKILIITTIIIIFYISIGKIIGKYLMFLKNKDETSESEVYVGFLKLLGLYIFTFLIFSRIGI